ncbi:LuxR C-terminal-related transcriptional regulator [Adlercreutzia sp. ZJ242]|uniref:LuxR C-terminal-related transcriptional regulator n=1 Tax=Adlercreutzia sp. ZJ242 TaxID=2709409 RepID=UPI0013EA8F71|nr:LuxR C-terminal-related transcriptional regulator [Adlercreutzia sp. ZJ242]
MGITVRYSAPGPVRKEYCSARLRQELERGLDKPFVFVCAPTGFGKTTILSRFARSLSLKPQWHVAWLGLAPDRGARRPFDLVGEIISAFAHMPDQEMAAPAKLIDAASDRGLERWGDVVRALGAIQGRVALFLDGIENLDETSLGALNHIVTTIPERVNIIVSGQRNPGIVLFHLRANEEVCELGADDLALTEAEISAFFMRRGMALAGYDAALLAERTNGWIIGLRIIAAVAGGASNPRAVMESPEAIQPWVDEYLDHGAASRLGRGMRRFVLKMSLFDEFDERLVGAFVESDELSRCMEEAVAQNLFVRKRVAVAQGAAVRYRVHPLFAAELRRRAYLMLDEDEIRAVSDLAIGWYETRGFYAQAITTSLAVKAYDRAFQVLSDNLYAVLSKDLGGDLSRWLEGFSYQGNRYEYLFCLLHAWSAFVGGKTKRALTWLERSERARASASEGVLRGTENVSCAVKTGTLVFSGRYQEAVSFGMASLERLGGPQLFLRCTVMHNVGEALVRLGRFDNAYEFFARARIDAELAGRRVIDMLCSSEMAYIQYLRCNLDASSNILLRSLSSCTEEESEKSWPVGLLQVGMARAYLGWGDVEKARNWLGHALKRLRPAVNRDGYLEARTLLAQVKMADGSFDEAYDLLLENYELIHLDRVPRGIDLLCLLSLVECLMGLGEAARALSVLEETASRVAQQDVLSELSIRCYRARIWMMEGRCAEAAPLFAEVEEQARTAGLTLLSIESQVGEACARSNQGEQDAALDLVAAALTRAAAESLVVVFEKSFPGLSALVYEIAYASNVNRVVSGDRARASRFAQEIMEKHLQRSDASTADGLEQDRASLLSPRERQVYELLKLGKTRKQISEELNIQINTVRTHVRNVYQKTGIHDRSML